VEESSQTPGYPPTSINADDAFDQVVENLVGIPKVAVEIDPRNEKRRAPNKFVLRIKPSIRFPQPLKVTALKAGGQIFISLVTERGVVLRQYHHQYGNHPNPDKNIVGRSHKHFPTKKYPLREGHKGIDTWAYEPEPYPQEFAGAVKEFCAECNITIEALQERASLRWF